MVRLPIQYSYDVKRYKNALSTVDTLHEHNGICRRIHRLSYCKRGMRIFHSYMMLDPSLIVQHHEQVRNIKAFKIFDIHLLQFGYIHDYMHIPSCSDKFKISMIIMFWDKNSKIIYKTKYHHQTLLWTGKTAYTTM